MKIKFTTEQKNLLKLKYENNSARYDAARYAAHNRYPLALRGSFSPSLEMLRQREAYSAAVDIATEERKQADRAAESEVLVVS